MSFQAVKLVDAITIQGAKGDKGDKGDPGDPGTSGVATIDQVISLELANAPRRIYWVYGDSSDGGTTPDTATQSSINALLAVGVPANNIRWLYETGGSLFVIDPLRSSPSVQPITLYQGTGSFGISGLVGAATINNILLAQSGGNFFISGLSDSSTIGNITLSNPGNYFLPANLSDASTLGDNIVLVLTGGNLVSANLTGASTVFNIALSLGIFSDSFNDGETLSDKWDITTGGNFLAGNSLTISSNRLQAVLGSSDAGLTSYLLASKSTYPKSTGTKTKINAITFPSGVHDYLILQLLDSASDGNKNKIQLQIVYNGTGANVYVYAYDNGGSNHSFVSTTNASCAGLWEIRLTSSTEFTIYKDGSSILGPYNYTSYATLGSNLKMSFYLATDVGSNQTFVVDDAYLGN